MGARVEKVGRIRLSARAAKGGLLAAGAAAAITGATFILAPRTFSPGGADGSTGAVPGETAPSPPSSFGRSSIDTTDPWIQQAIDPSSGETSTGIPSTTRSGGLAPVGAPAVASANAISPPAGDGTQAEPPTSPPAGDGTQAEPPTSPPAGGDPPNEPPTSPPAGGDPPNEPPQGNNGEGDNGPLPADPAREVTSAAEGAQKQATDMIGTTSQTVVNAVNSQKKAIEDLLAIIAARVVDTAMKTVDQVKTLVAGAQKQATDMIGSTSKTVVDTANAQKEVILGIVAAGVANAVETAQTTMGQVTTLVTWAKQTAATAITNIQGTLTQTEKDARGLGAELQRMLEKSAGEAASTAQQAVPQEALVATVFVDAQSAEGSWLTVEPGKTYTLQASGTYNYWTVGHEADAECSRTPGDPTWLPDRWSSNLSPRDPLDLFIHNPTTNAPELIKWMPVTDTGAGCNAATGTGHEYRHKITPSRDRVNLRLDVECRSCATGGVLVRLYAPIATPPSPEPQNRPGPTPTPIPPGGTIAADIAPPATTQTGDASNQATEIAPPATTQTGDASNQATEIALSAATQTGDASNQATEIATTVTNGSPDDGSGTSLISVPSTQSSETLLPIMGGAVLPLARAVRRSRRKK